VNLSKECDVNCARVEELYKNSLINGTLSEINNNLEAKEKAEMERKRITSHTSYLFLHKVVPLCNEGGDLSEVMGEKQVILNRAEGCEGRCLDEYRALRAERAGRGQGGH